MVLHSSVLTLCASVVGVCAFSLHRAAIPFMQLYDLLSQAQNFLGAVQNRDNGYTL